MVATRSLALAVATMLVVATAPAAATSEAGAVETGRVSGEDRISTAAAIAVRAHPRGASRAYLARADEPIDALVAGALTDGPVLLVPSCDGLPHDVSGALGQLGVSEVVALGGSRAVCDETLDAAAGPDRTRQRLAGLNRFETAVQIARRGFPEGAGVVYLVAAAAGPDATVAGTLEGGPILPVPVDSSVPDVIHAVVDDLDPDRVVAIGGTAVLPDAVVETVADGRPIERLAGADRSATSVAVAEAVHPEGTGTVYVVNANDPVDAVAAGALRDGPVLLTPGCGTVPPVIRDVLSASAPTEIVALGGPSAVCPTTLGRLAGAAPPAAPSEPLATEDEVFLAELLTVAERSLRGGESDPDWLRELSRWQHAIYRWLTVAHDVRDRVMRRLPTDLRPVAAQYIAAGSELRAMVKELKDEPPDHWRIVEPPPIDELRGYYLEAERRYGVPWVYLAAIHLVETRFGKIHGTSTAGAQGPMQFMPSTWEAYGEGDINDPHDAIMAAGRYLRAHGAPSDMPRALYAYNHSNLYVRAVTRYAQQIAGDQDLLRAFHQWEVWYLTTRGDVLLPVGWPEEG